MTLWTRADWRAWSPTRRPKAGTCGTCIYIRRDEVAMRKGTRSSFACAAYTYYFRIPGATKPPPSWCPQSGVPKQVAS